MSAHLGCCPGYEHTGVRLLFAAGFSLGRVMERVSNASSEAPLRSTQPEAMVVPVVVAVVAVAIACSAVPRIVVERPTPDDTVVHAPHACNLPRLA